MTGGMLDWKFLTEKTPDRRIYPIYIWLLKKICKQIVKQSNAHRSNIVQYFRIMSEATEKEFTEDNKPTHDAFLRECLEEALQDETI